MFLNKMINKWPCALQENLMITHKEVEEHDFDTNIKVFHLDDEIDVEKEPLKELLKMLKHHEMMKLK